MNKKNKKNAIDNLKKEIEKLNNNTFKIFFMVYSTNGRPNSSIQYIYETAFHLNELGYKVEMLYIEKDFVGVEEWLGKKYSNLPHRLIKDNLSVSPSDFLILPEVHAGIIAQTKDLPCKRIILIQNTHYFFDRMALTATMDNLKIHDCITTSENLKNRINKWFPNLRVKIISPSISDEFSPSDKQQKLIINVVAKNPNDVNAIVKPFYWTYPLYSWVTFRDLRGLNKTDFANRLKEGAITVWIDDKTDFGYAPLEAMKCKNLVIGKVPENQPEWLVDENGVVKDNGLWFYENDTAIEMIANAVETLISDEIPSQIYEEGLATVSDYTSEKQNKDIENIFINEYIEGRKNELALALKALTAKEEEK